MSKTIAFFSPKGGAGKTTVSILLANILYFYFDWNFVVIDADFPQNDLAKIRKDELAELDNNPRLKKLYELLYAEKAPYPIIPTNIASCVNRIEEWKDKVDFILLDITGTFNQPDLPDLLTRINHFLIPTRQGKSSLRAALQLYITLQQKIRPVSPHFEDCHIFFNHIPFRNRLASISPNIPEQFKILPDFIPQHAAYEFHYQSTLFPIPKTTKEGVKLIQFAQQLVPLLEGVETA